MPSLPVSPGAILLLLLLLPLFSFFHARVYLCKYSLDVVRFQVLGYAHFVKPYCCVGFKQLNCGILVVVVITCLLGIDYFHFSVPKSIYVNIVIIFT